MLTPPSVVRHRVTGRPFSGSPSSPQAPVLARVTADVAYALQDLGWDLGCDLAVPLGRGRGCASSGSGPREVADERRTRVHNGIKLEDIRSFMFKSLRL